MRPERCQSPPDLTDDLRAMLETVLKRQERLVAMLAQLLPMPEPAPESQSVPPLVQALADAFGPSCFTAREAWQRAAEDAGRATARGEPEPRLPATLREMRVDSTRSLGFHLSRLEAERAGIRRGGLHHNTNSWEVLPWARRQLWTPSS